MSAHHVFLSYKRDDEARAARLAKALEAHGLTVWWDRGLPGGESWHQQIQAALESAGCVVVLWTDGSVGPAGGFVRDEARHAVARSILVPVLLDKVEPPLGFGELQAIDLTHWRHHVGDAFLLDLVAAVRAKLEGRAVPPARGPALRWARRFTAGGVASALLAGSVFAADLFNVRDTACSVPLLQPQVSDLCGTLGIAGRPTRTERLAWEARTPTSCAALRAHVERFPGGALRGAAADLLTAARIERAPSFSAASPREVRAYVRQSERPLSSDAQAKADALSRAEADARSTMCAPRDEFERLQGADITPEAYDCRADARGGVVCALDYRAVCRIEARALVELCG